MNTRFPMIPLKEVLTQYKEYISSPEPKIYPKLSVKLYGKGVVLDEPADGTFLKMKKHQIAKSGQVILSEIWGKKGAIGFVPPEGDGALCTSHFFLFDVRYDKIDPGYLQAIFTANYLEDQLDTKAKGSTSYAAVRPKHLLAARIPLPPLDEQRRTVARIEELAAKIEEAQKLRRQAAEEAEGLVSTLLGKMFEQKKTVVGTLGEGIESARNGISRRPTGIESGPIVLRLADVSEGKVNLTNPRRGYLSDDEIETYGLLSEDLLFVRVNGSKNIVGRCIPFIGAKEQVCFNDHLIRVRLNQTIFDWRFVARMANSPISREYIIKTAITTAGQLTINQKMLANIPIPILPLTEQRRIVARLDELQAQVDGLKKHQVRTAEELDALLPSVLDRAFRGEL